MQEPVHADPAVPGLPDEVRHRQQRGNRDREREPPRTQNVAPPDRERRDQQHEDDCERVLRLQPDAGGDAEQHPGATAEREPQREPEHEHRRQLIERDGLEEIVRREDAGRERDADRGERLRAPVRAEIARDERRDDDRRDAGKHREGAEPEQRPAVERVREGGDQRRHGRELDVAALEMAAGDGVVERVAVPAVPVGERKLERGLQQDDDRHRPKREATHIA